jgi:UDP-N-acetylmuramyl pentapeptide phosphotransferase/UDP-N-acetylglucosamine-1-phosphate transferase
MVVTIIVVAATAFAATFLGTKLLLRVLQAHAILDHPNERSSHAAATPVGGGLVVIGVIAGEWLLVWALSAVQNGGEFTYPVPLVVGITLALAAVSWRDDRKPLSPVLRLVVQAFAVLIGIAALSAHGRIFQTILPYWLDIVFTAWAWLWLINLTNFMDGIDGITSVEGSSIGVGVAILAPFAAAVSLSISVDPQACLWVYAVVLAAAVAGFAWWNWQPARIFLGDVGAIPLGFLFGWLLLEIAGAGLWAPALLLPLYYLMDATLTLGRRVMRHERLLEAHRSHFYQRAALRLGSHKRVVQIILALNVALVALASASAMRPDTQAVCLVVGVVLTSGVLWYFARDATPTP